MQFKRGDIVVATSERYLCTSRSNEWIGIVVAAYGFCFSAKTIKRRINGTVGHIFDDLCQKDFTLLNQAIKDGVKVEH